MLMVTYEGLFQFVIMLIALISLLYKEFQKKITAHSTDTVIFI